MTPEASRRRPRQTDEIQTLGDVYQLYEQVLSFAEKTVGRKAELTERIPLQTGFLELTFYNVQATSKIVQIREGQPSHFDGIMWGPTYIIDADSDTNIAAYPLR